MKTAHGGSGNRRAGAGSLAGRLCLFACFLALAATLASCHGREEQGAMARPTVSGVVVASVEAVEVDEVFEGSGTVKSDNTSVVSSRVMGAVTMLKVREGDQVEAGQLLMTIDDRDAAERAQAAKMAVEAARQSRDLARKTWQRYSGLYESKALSRHEADQIETQLNVSEAEYARARAMADEAETNLGFTRITAPASGRVIERKIDVGSMASPGMPLITIEGREGMYVAVAVDESLTGKIRPGMPAEAVVGSLQKTLDGTVREIVPAVDPSSRTFTAKVFLKDAGLRSGLFTRVRIPVGKRSAVVVPDRAIVSKGQLTGVYAVDGQGVVTYRLIRTGKKFPVGTEVLSGLTPGEKIITGNVDKAVDGGVIASPGAE